MAKTLIVDDEPNLLRMFEFKCEPDMFADLEAGVDDVYENLSGEMLLTMASLQISY